MLSFTSNSTEVNVSVKYSIICCVIMSLMHYNFFNHAIVQSNLLTISLTTVIYFVVLTNIQFLVKMRNIEMVKSLKSLHSLPKLSAFLVFGVLFHGISMLSSSFIEEEHQTWYYLNSAVWILLYLMETRHLLNEKSPKKTAEASSAEHESIFQNQLKWALLFVGHLVARRLNQTGDKWLSIPDIGDWLQMEENRIWNSFFTSASLLFVYLTSLDFGGILTNVLTLTACMLIYYYRTLTGFVYFAGIKPNG